MSSNEPRRCSRCKETKPRSEFPGVHGYCRPCHTTYNREQGQKHAARIADYTRRINLRRYGLTVERFNALVAEQDGKCAICQCDEPGGQGVWHVDHDHTCCNSRKTSCGKCIRGLLCSRCNIGLGNFKEDPVVVRMAVVYLERYLSERALQGDRLPVKQRE
jgi:hypothetical protein